ncbi:MAG: ArnT family glycosyltransferase [Bacteroidota bacterium]
MKVRELLADQRFQIGIVIVVALLRFVNLGYLDLQPYDESTYAIRAQTVLKFGDWLDQTPHGIDGAYSSSHPPLYVWLTALAYKVFGVNEFSARFFSAVFGACTIVLVYFFGTRLFSHTTGFIAALFLGLNPFYTFWTRQGQFDVALVFFLTLGAYLYLLSLDSTKPWRYFLAAGAAIGLGLMTKLFVCLIFPFVALAAMLVFDRVRWARHVQAIIVSTAVAFVIALPWHAMMTIRYGDGDPLYFLTVTHMVGLRLGGNGATLNETFRFIEESFKPLGPLYFPNQLIVTIPYAILLSLYGFWKVVRHRGSFAEFFLLLWFAIYFLIITAIRMKLAVYILPLFVPISLLAAHVVERMTKQEIPRKAHLLLLVLTVISIGWSLKHEWRIAAKNLITSLAQLQMPSIPDLYAVGLFLLLSAFAILVLYELQSRQHSQRWLSVRLPSLMLVPLVLVFLFSVAILDRFRHDDGANGLAQFLKQRSYSELYIVGGVRNPQLSYYLDGADLGWHPSKFVLRMHLKAGSDRIRDFLASRVSQPGQFYLVVERSELLIKGIGRYGDVLPPGFQLILETRRYALFQKQELYADTY